MISKERKVNLKETAIKSQQPHVCKLCTAKAMSCRIEIPTLENLPKSVVTLAVGTLSSFKLITKFEFEKL